METTTQTITKAVIPTRPLPVLHELGWLQGTPLVRLADRYFGEHADIGLALAIAVALPLLRSLLDHVVFKVGMFTHSRCEWMMFRVHRDGTAGVRWQSSCGMLPASLMAMARLSL